MEIVCQDDQSDPWLTSWNVPVHPVGRAPLTYGFSRALDGWLAENIREFDAVIVNGIWMYLSFAVWKAATRYGIPYYVFTHGFLDPWFKQQYPLKHLKKILYWRIFEHKIIRDAKAVLFTTEEEKRLAHNAFHPYRLKAVVANFGITAPALDNAGAERQIFVRELSRSHPALNDQPYILFLGRLHEKKGVALLLRAFSMLQASSENLQLVIAGPGEDSFVNRMKATTLELGIQNRVVWTGPIYGEDKWTALRGAEAFILPSHQENFGISVAEALACGTPVLISDKVNIWREVDQHRAGLVAADSVDGTLQLLKSWLALSTNDRHLMGLQARRCFALCFEATRCSTQLFEFIEAQDKPSSPAVDSVHGEMAQRASQA